MSAYDSFAALDTGSTNGVRLQEGNENFASHTPSVFGTPGMPAAISTSLNSTTMTDKSDINDIRLSNAALLKSIANGDWQTYSLLVDDRITCFEPEACGKLVKGKLFHKHYFELDKSSEQIQRNETICDEAIRIMGDTALVTYVRLIQSGFKTISAEETRVWRRAPHANSQSTAIGKWKLVHFHRSHPTSHFVPS